MLAVRLARSRIEAATGETTTVMVLLAPAITTETGRLGGERCRLPSASYHSYTATREKVPLGIEAMELDGVADTMTGTGKPLSTRDAPSYWRTREPET